MVAAGVVGGHNGCVDILVTADVCDPLARSEMRAVPKVKEQDQSGGGAGEIVGAAEGGGRGRSRSLGHHCGLA